MKNDKSATSNEGAAAGNDKTELRHDKTELPANDGLGNSNLYKATGESWKWNWIDVPYRTE